MVVEEVPPSDGLAWRTRMQYVHLPDGQRGLRRHRSHEVVPIDRCLIAHPDAREPEEGTLSERVEVSAGAHGFEVAADGFWQPHVSAPTTLVECVLDLLEPEPGEWVLDLYAGVGLFSAFLAEQGRTRRVGRGRRGRPHCLPALPGQPRGVPLDAVALRSRRPGPRAAASAPRTSSCWTRRGSARSVRSSARSPRSSRARWRTSPATRPPSPVTSAYFAEHGYSLARLRAFDLFPMTHHVECVALLVPA